MQHRVVEPVVAMDDRGRAPRPAPIRESASRKRSSAGSSSVFERSHCCDQRRTWRSMNPSGRPKPARPTASGSIACSAASTSISAVADGSTLGGRVGVARRQIVSADVSDHPFHDVELNPKLGILAPEQQRPGDRYRTSVQSAEDPVFAAHVVGGRKDMSERRPAQDHLTRIRPHPVGEVRLPARDQRHLASASSARSCSDDASSGPTIRGSAPSTIGVPGRFAINATHRHASGGSCQLRMYVVSCWGSRSRVVSAACPCTA